MKANEAPEKLYIPFEDEIDIDCLNTYAQKGTYIKEIEYTRTDAFIAKAKQWLLTNANDYCILHNSYDTKELVKDFVDAMKDE